MKIINGCAIEYFKNYEGRIVLAHSVNCKNVMGRGIAKKIAHDFPVIKKVYSASCRNAADDNTLLGNAQLVWLEDYPGKYIVNLFSQLRYGIEKRHTNYAAFGKSLLTMRDLLQAEKKAQIIFPYGIGCGLAGGDWITVERIISDVFPDSLLLKL